MAAEKWGQTGESLLGTEVAMKRMYMLQVTFDFRLRASSPIWASEASLAKTCERAAKPRGALARAFSRGSCPNRRACSQANLISG